ncbi:hypothetical protein BsWGS_00683 [Bradybaena similaris]
MVVAGQSAVLPGDLCAQNPQWKMDVCGFVSNINNSNMGLFNKLKTRITMFTPNVIQDAKNVSSIEHFYRELLKYKGTFNRLNSSMKAYMNTSRFSTERTIVVDGNFANSYVSLINKLITELNQTIDRMSTVVTLNASLDRTIEVVTKKTSGDIYQETFHATTNLKLLVETWKDKCDKC